METNQHEPETMLNGVLENFERSKDDSDLYTVSLDWSAESNKPLELSVRFFPEKMKEPNRIKAELFLWSYDVWDFDEPYSDDLAGLKAALKRLGMNVEFKTYLDESDEDRDLATIELTATIEVPKNETEAFLKKLLKKIDNYNPKPYRGKKPNGYIGLWFKCTNDW